MGQFSVDALAGVEAFDRLLADGQGEGARSADPTIGTEPKSWLRTTPNECACAPNRRALAGIKAEAVVVTKNEEHSVTR
jgi:hypothetical protein